MLTDSHLVQFIFSFLGTGTMVATLKHVGTTDWDMTVNTPASWSVHALRTQLGMPSGSVALQGLTRLNVFLTSTTEKEEGAVHVSGP